MSENHTPTEFQPENNSLQPLPPETEKQTASPSNPVLGVAGAIVGAALGGIVWILVYQLGYIAAPCGLLMVFLAMKGYELAGKGLDRKGIILSVVVAAVMIYGAAYAAIVVSVYREIGSGISLEFAFRLTQMALTDPEAKSQFTKELLTGYGLSALCAFGMVIRRFKEAK